MPDLQHILAVDRLLCLVEREVGSTCPIRSVPLDMVTDAVLTRLGKEPPTETAMAWALQAVLMSYCATYLPPRRESIEIFGIAAP